MNMRNFSIGALALALAGLAACTASGNGGGGGGTTTADAVTGADGATKDGIVIADAGKGDVTVVTGDTTGTGTDAGADAGGQNACCAAKKAQCGFVPGCPASCGGCPTGKQCDTKPGSPSQYTCIDKTASKPLKKNGEACGPNADCPKPPNNATTEAKQAYYQCLNDQCDGGRCFLGVCSKSCKIATDKKDNNTGADVANGDGIEDPDSVSECTGFADGPAGSAFKCVNLFSPADPNQLAICTPGTTFAPCKANSDCKNGEVCGYKQIRGNLIPVCAPPYKEADGKPGTTLANACNDDPKGGAVATCKNDLCIGIGCVDFCKSDADCITDVGACQSGKCAGTGKACTGDVDCSAWMCKKNQPFFGEKQAPVDVCLPKSCYLDEDCGNPAYYCLSSYNGVKSQDGDPDPTDPKKITMPGWDQSMCVKKAPNTAKKGEACDDFPNDDDTTVKQCENKYWCNLGVCEGHCKTDANCPSGSKCGVVEIPLDTSNPADKTYDVFTALKVCQPMPGATKTCYGQGDCKAEAKAKYCRPFETEIPMAQGATPTTDKYTMLGYCIEPEKDFGSVGLQCGQSNSKECKSGLCLGQQDSTGKTAPGWCTDMCSGKADCPNSAVFTGYNNQEVKLYCGSIAYGNNATKQPYDNIYLPVCLPDLGSTLADCSSDFKCAAAGEACIPIAISTGPDQATTMEFRCRVIKNQQNDPAPTKKVGELCNPKPAASDPEECASGLCFPDSTTGKGYCSALCKDNSACGSNDSMFCDVGHMYTPRKDASKAGIAPMCLKKKSCVPCAYDFQCATGTLCTWTDTKADTGRCAPPCDTDADCAKTDGGGKCEAQKDVDGKDVGKKVCTPTNCK